MKNQYICKLCNTSVTLESDDIITNQTACQCCGNTNLTLNSDRAKTFLDNLDWHTTKLVTYRLDTSNVRERETYETIVTSLNQHKHYTLYVGELSQDVMEQLILGPSRLECLLDSFNGFCWFTKRGPLHPWFERKLQSSRIKTGYYISLTPQMERKAIK